MNRSGYLLLSGLAILYGCQTTGHGNDTPARIAEPSDASRMELHVTVNEALNTEVLLADDALMSNSTLTVERNPPAGMQGQLATGRNMDAPIRFQLVMNDSNCVLIDTRDQSRYLLENTTCVAE